MNIEAIQAVITANHAIQMEARRWNVRAGEIVFPVMTSEEWKLWLASRLNGAISCATITNPDLLRLPALDVDLVNMTREMNPDSITVLGKELPVEYCSGCAPRVWIDFREDEANDWLKLPDEICLPGGREVSVCSAVEGYGYYIEAPSSQFKAKVRERLNQGQWEKWSDRPVITVPTEITDEVTLPEIITAVYGRCVVTSEPLVAYGTLTAYRYWSSDPITWKSEWFRVRSEAEEAFSKAQAELEKAKVEAQERWERESVQKGAEAAKEKARKLYREIPYDDTGDLSDRLYNQAYIFCIPSDNAEIRQWTIETEAIIAEVEVVLAEIRRKKEAAAEALRELARPILRPGETESESTVYGVPCNDDGPCDLESAKSWRLYSHRDGELRPYKGFRSSARGKTLRELVRDYMCGDQDVEAVLASLPAETCKSTELDPILDVVSDLATARSAKAFAEAALGCVGGNIVRAIRILDNESNAVYGRARRQDAIRKNLPGIDNTEAGQRFLGHYQAAVTNEELAGAVAWLQSLQSSNGKKSAPAIGVQSVRPAEPQAPPATGNSLDALASKWGGRLK